MPVTKKPTQQNEFTLPFTSIAMDFIVKLPLSNTYNTILTITDTFSKALIFIPCKETTDAENTALLYATYVLPHYGLSSCIIYHTWQRPQVHSYIYQGTVPYPTSGTKQQYSIPPTNQQSIWTHKPKIRTISMHLYWLSPKQLGSMVTSGTIHFKCIAKTQPQGRLLLKSSWDIFHVFTKPTNSSHHLP